MILRLFKVTKGARGILFLKAFIGILITVTYIVQAVLLAKGVRYSFIDLKWEKFLPVIMGILVLILIRAVLVWAGEVFGKYAASRVKETIRINLFSYFFRLGPGYMEEGRTGKVEAIFIDGVEAIEVFLVNYIPQVMVTLTGLVGMIAFIFTIDFIIVIIITICVIVCIISPTLWDKLMHRMGSDHWESYGNLNSQFVDAMQGMTTLKAFNASDAMGNSLEKDADSLYKSTMKKLTVSLTSTAFVSFASAAGISLSIGIAALHMCTGMIDVEGLTVILFLSTECFRPINDLNTYWHQSFLGFSAAEKMFEFMDTETDVIDRDDVKLPDDIHPDISFEDVSFSYDSDKGNALKNFTMKVRPDAKVAIVGKSGSGKSTVVNLLMRYFDCQTGQIRIGGREIHDFKIGYLRSLISVVFQDTYLFYGTVAENIRVARPDADINEIERCCKVANAHEFISELPEGYETMIGERGTRLSGGERQRIAIARAVLKNAPILVLDEATSSVDATNESLIQNSLDNVMKDKTTLVIAHRLSTIIDADEIFVLDGGELAEHGSAEKLMDQKGVFSALISAQNTGEEMQQ